MPAEWKSTITDDDMINDTTLTHRAVPVPQLDAFIVEITAIVERLRYVVAPDLVGQIESIGLRLAPRHFEPIPTPNPTALRKLLAEWFDGELLRTQEFGSSLDWPTLIEDAKSRHETFGLPWNDAFVPGYMWDLIAANNDDT